MRYSQHTVPATSPLARAVHSIWRLRDDAPRNESDAILPDGHVEIVLNLAEPFERTEYDGRTHRQARALFVGQQTSSAHIRPTGHVNLFGIRFHLAGAATLLGFPQSEARDQIIALDVVAPRIAQLLRDETELLACEPASDNDDMERRVAERVIAGLECAVERNESNRMRARMHERSRGREIAMRASAHLAACAGRTGIDALAVALGASRRRVERAFDEHVGISPKLLARIVRFQHACRLAHVRCAASWTDIALQSGYFDQAHFIRDFREFAGIPPSAFAAETRPLSEVFVWRGA